MMSSFGAYDVSMKEAKIDYLVSSSNKCLQGVPGFSFVVANKENFLNTECKIPFIIKIYNFFCYRQCPVTQFEPFRSMEGIRRKWAIQIHATNPCSQGFSHCLA